MQITDDGASPAQVPARAARAELAPALIVAAQAGQESALRELVRRYEGAVVAVLSRTLLRRASEARVEELAQEVFLKAFAALDRYDSGRAKLSTWVCTIASRLAIDELRRRQPELSAGPTATLPEMAGHGDSEAAARQRQTLDHLSAVLDTLTDTARAAFVLQVFHGMTQVEIAAALEIPEGTVKSRLSRAHARVREAMKEFRDG